MQLKEFNEKTGLGLSEAQFEKVHDMYIWCASDEETFINDYKEHGKSILLNDYYNRYRLNSNLYHSTQVKLQACADKLLCMASAAGDADAYRMVVDILGEKETILSKVRLQIAITPEEIEWLNKHLR